MDALMKPKNTCMQKSQNEVGSPCVVIGKSANPKKMKKRDFPQKRTSIWPNESEKCKLPKQEKGSTTFETKSQSASHPRKKTHDDKLDLTPSLKSDLNTLSFNFPNKDRKTIQDLLIRNKDHKNRFELVFQHISADTNGKADNGENSLKTESDLVMIELPTVDSSDVFAVLKSLPPSPYRAKRAIEVLRKCVDDQNPKAPMSSSSSSPMMQDFKVLRMIFPDESPLKIIDLIKLHEVKKDRLQIVSNELCERQEYGTKNEDVLTLASDSKLPRSSASDLAEDQGVNNPQAALTDVSKITTMNQTSDYQGVTEADHSETHSYPQKHDTVADFRTKSFMKEFTLDKFLEKYPNPDKTFCVETDEISKLYQRHVIFALQIAFPFLETEYLESILDKHNHHLYPSYLEVIAVQEMSHLIHPKVDITLTPFSSEPDERLYDEWWYIHNEQKVTEYLSMKEITQLMKHNEPEKKQQFSLCCCCYEEECLFEDLLSCPEGHLFCKLCLIRSTEAVCRGGKTKFPCLNGQCDKVLPLSTLQSNLPSNLFSKIVNHIQMDEVKQANIPDLVICPFCPFAIIMPNRKDKFLKCLNPECLKESCRLCHKQHDKFAECEVGTQEKKLRTVIDNIMAEAVIRKCHKCGMRFIKDFGCNRMTCVCGATSCYVCKKRDVGFDHFHWRNRCNLFEKASVIHQRDLEALTHESTVMTLSNYPKDVTQQPNSSCDLKSKSWKPRTNQECKDRCE